MILEKSTEICVNIGSGNSHYLNQCWLISNVKWHSYEGHFTTDSPGIDHYPSKNYRQFSSTILIQFSCNSHAIIDEIFRNAPAILTYNSHPILTRQFSPAILIQFSPAILIQFSPDNSHPIFTFQFSSNSHLTILFQFSPTILTQFSSTLLSQFSPTMLSQFFRNDQSCYFYSMLIL